LVYRRFKERQKGKLIYFIGYSKELDNKGNPFELWQPEPTLNKSSDAFLE